MSTQLNKPFKHFSTYALFNATKVSANESNTAYILNGQTYEGTPDILWEHAAFINDTAQIWNRGRFYGASKYLKKLNATTKNTFIPWNKAIVTIIDKSSTGSLLNLMSIFDDYPGILPSIVAYSSVSDPEVLAKLLDHGCDILSSSSDGTSKYSGSATDVQNFQAIQNDMAIVENWLAQRSMFTNCYKYPDASVAEGEADYIMQFEEYGVKESSTGLNGYTQDNALLNAIYVTSNYAAATDEIDTAVDENLWCIIMIDSSVTSSGVITEIIDCINDYVERGELVYLQMNEALKARGVEFNIGRGSELPFRVYKNGVADIKLSDLSLSYIQVKSDWDEDDPTSSSYILNKPGVESAASGGDTESLVTTGEKYEWNNKLSNTATGSSSLTIAGTATTAQYATNIGAESTAGNSGTAVGYRTAANGARSVSIGYNARIGAATSNAIQIGYGTNATASSLAIGFNNTNYQLLDGTTGLIPDARLSSNIARTSQIPSFSSLAFSDLSQQFKEDLMAYVAANIMDVLNAQGEVFMQVDTGN